MATDLIKDLEEVELGIYEDKGSGTDLSDSEEPSVSQNRQLSRDGSSANTTHTPRADIDIEDGVKVEPLHASITEQKEISIDAASSTVEAAEKENESFANANSVDPALEIRGILKTPMSRDATGPSPSRLNTSAPNTPAIRITGPSPSASKELLSAVRDIDYIEKKCVGTDTRRRMSSYHFRESPALKAVTSAQSRDVYLYQTRPSPMSPLKAWKGYSGNIYFNPIKINRVSSANGAIETVSRSQAESVAVNNEVKKTRLQTAKPDLSVMTHCDLPPKPAVIMDKQIVMDKQNKDIQDDLYWIRSTEDVGSLKIERGLGDSRTKEKRFDQRSLQKGSVAHKLAKQKISPDQQVKDTNRRMFAVSGDKFTPPSYMSPLLKSSTQYTQSPHRPVSNISDVSRRSSVTERLPPLEQIRASLRGNFSTKSLRAKKAVKIVTDQKIPSYIKLNKTELNNNQSVSLHMAAS
ncbi:uncharacterized protein [Watersipora subatra]|uniref:uncharacterized protein n=1 Tax=Watersipora subatra TaxID=2589382 RepID=UPI00355C94B2